MKADELNEGDVVIVKIAGAQPAPAIFYKTILRNKALVYQDYDQIDPITQQVKPARRYFSVRLQEIREVVPS